MNLPAQAALGNILKIAVGKDDRHARLPADARRGHSGSRGLGSVRLSCALLV
jgi:hypothetical protein